MSYASIQQAIEKQLITIPGLPAVNYENTDYSPVIDTPWLRVTHFPSENRPSGIGISAPNLYRGLTLVNVFYPARAGAKDAKAMVDLICSYFQKGTQLLEDGLQIWISYSEASGSSQEPNWFMIPVTIRWYCYV